MNYSTIPYDGALNYLLRYAVDDWLEMAIVVDHANQVLGAEATKGEIVDMTIRLSADLIDHQVLPGELVAQDPGFRAWPGGKKDLMDRLGRELREMVARDRLPMPTEVCWFHVVDPNMGM